VKSQFKAGLGSLTMELVAVQCNKARTRFDSPCEDRYHSTLKGVGMSSRQIKKGLFLVKSKGIEQLVIANSSIDALLIVIG